MDKAIPRVTLKMAAELMRAGETVIFPTETFFGVGSRALDADASAKVFKVKHRATVKPIPIILGDLEQLDIIAKVPDLASDLLQRFWPGPLSVLFDARLRIPDILTGGTGRVAVRLSSHPVARELSRSLGEPITASSANISGNPSVTCAEELDPALLNAVSGVLDLPPAPMGKLPSTLVEFVGEKNLHILREGFISKMELEKAGFSIA